MREVITHIFFPKISKVFTPVNFDRPYPPYQKYHHLCLPNLPQICLVSLLFCCLPQRQFPRVVYMYQWLIRIKYTFIHKVLVIESSEQLMCSVSDQKIIIMIFFGSSKHLFWILYNIPNLGSITHRGYNKKWVMYVQLIIINIFIGHILCCGKGRRCEGMILGLGMVEVIRWFIIQIIELYCISHLVGILIYITFIPKCLYHG